MMSEQELRRSLDDYCLPHRLIPMKSSFVCISGMYFLEIWNMPKALTCLPSRRGEAHQRLFMSPLPLEKESPEAGRQ